MNIKKIQIYFIATCCLISLSMLTKVAHAESKPIGNCYYVSSQRGRILIQDYLNWSLLKV